MEPNGTQLQSERFHDIEAAAQTAVLREQVRLLSRPDFVILVNVFLKNLIKWEIQVFLHFVRKLQLSKYFKVKGIG